MVINSYLYPLVKELKTFQHGIKLQLPSLSVIRSTHPVIVRIVLGPVICDILASRKTCGFLGHSARLGCSKCFKPFPVEAFHDLPDYLGYDIENWPLRNINDHHLHACYHRESESKAAEQRIEHEHGCCYSILLDLQYFDIV